MKPRMNADKRRLFVILLVLCAVACLAACQPGVRQAASEESQSLRVLASASFLADIAQNVAGERLKVESLIPSGLDPHAFEPTPRDVARIADSQVLVVNGAGFEAWLEDVLVNAGGERLLIEASQGLAGDSAGNQAGGKKGEPGAKHAQEVDPHFWLDPSLAVRYVENIRDGLSQADPAGADTYAQNAANYIAQLKELDAWIQAQLLQIPPERRLLVTNHESFGYFADRYGFKVVGAVIPSISTGSSPSAEQLAQLVDAIRSTHAPAIFLEIGANPALAEQVAAETGIRVVTDLYSHSLTPPDGVAPTYLDMMRHNVQVIVDALR